MDALSADGLGVKGGQLLPALPAPGPWLNRGRPPRPQHHTLTSLPFQHLPPEPNTVSVSGISIRKKRSRLLPGTFPENQRVYKHTHTDMCTCMHAHTHKHTHTHGSMPLLPRTHCALRGESVCAAALHRSQPLAGRRQAPGPSAAPSGGRGALGSRAQNTRCSHGARSAQYSWHRAGPG